MVEIYITLEEAAGFEGISYKGLTSRVNRHPDVYLTRTEPASTSGGKPRVLVSLSSLSKKARRAYKQAQNIQGEDIIISERAKTEEIPWYIYTDLAEYIEKNSKAYYEAVELSKIIHEFLNYGDRDRTEFAGSFAKANGMSQRTLYRHSQSYLEASAWALKMNKQDGKNYDFFKVLALCRKPKQKHTFPSLTPEVRAFIENLWFEPVFASNNGTIEMLYGKLMKIGSMNCWDIPSYPTVARYIGYLMDVKRGKNARLLAEKGMREFKNQRMVKASRNIKALPIMGLVQGDEHTFDVWVKYTYPNGKSKAVKPQLVAWLDTRSRCIVGDVICVRANSQVLKQSLLNMLYNEIGGVPEWLLIDNGKDYTAETMTGRKRNERVSFDSETKGFYRSIGIQDDMRSLPYQPWSKAQVERFFGTLISKFEKWLGSYTGTLTGSKTAAKVNKDIPKMLERDELLTLDEFYALWCEWRDEYHRSFHSGLKEQGDKWHTPLEVFQQAERYEKAPPPKSYATILMMKAERVLVRNIGIKKFGYEYRADELCHYIGDKVDIKWDQNDVTKLYVYTTDGDKICEAYSQELLLIAPKMPQKALEDHLKMQKRQLRQTKDELAYYTTPLEERDPQYQGYGNDVAGFIFKNDSTQKQGSTKLVAMPDDKQFKDELRSRKTAKANNEADDFYQKQAEKALAELRKLG
ncbi:Mu transposase C-terminal domain-containing protein [Paenibacillus melissococcoides]|uniref:Mu transposase C-terminal domain-containing protein n=2 Tax=Paenibacillus TaxID=44249 RepID=A0ABM9GAT1_9BACL|nr:Mu transposase C-terminal domain-containing protein [Paenibacillus melissococcoides]MEB9897516.1 Mu transposase C-terminal domain-containing protein [Bacillus cereus]CAH8248774.1 Mu transposase C-terminal domain-containing protein [Paenibacillus melissococcoides]CAH8713769.1 Mu transposase C-terminal domain-containing protein [Paenibacillus melissococcoides]CAH8720463.1 Mu transposase C-terminal domain-containing protein [Paenibacillus melissococcoides]